MAIVTAVLGILLYFLASRWPGGAIAAVAITLSLGGVALGLGYFAGAARPQLAAVAFQFTVLLPLTLGALAAAALLALTIYISSTKGEKPTPKVEGLASAIIGVLTATAAQLAAVNKLRPSSVARRAIYRRYHSRFPERYPGDTNEYVQAYKAIHDQALSDGDGQISGWGRKATRRRLALIRRALYW